MNSNCDNILVIGRRPEFGVTVSHALNFALAFVAALAAGFRIFGVDKDLETYFLVYTDPANPLGERFEPLFHSFSSASSYVGIPFEIFLFMCAFFALYVKFNIISYYSSNALPWILLYLLTLYPIHEMTQVRNAMAIAAVVAGWHLTLSRRSYFSGLLLFIIAAGFHYSALFLVAPAVLLFLPDRFRFLGGTAFLGAVLIFLYFIRADLEVLNPAVSLFLDLEYFEPNPISLRMLACGACLAVGVFYRDRLGPSGKIWLLLGIYGFASFYLFLAVPVFAFRFLEMTLLTYAFWIPRLPVVAGRFCLSLLFMYGINSLLEMIASGEMFVDQRF